MEYTYEHYVESSDEEDETTMMKTVLADAELVEGHVLSFKGRGVLSHNRDGDI